jgi:hypothetical protein
MAVASVAAGVLGTGLTASLVATPVSPLCVMSVPMAIGGMAAGVKSVMELHKEKVAKEIKKQIELAFDMKNTCSDTSVEYKKNISTKEAVKNKWQDSKKAALNFFKRKKGQGNSNSESIGEVPVHVNPLYQDAGKTNYSPLYESR